MHYVIICGLGHYKFTKTGISNNRVYRKSGCLQQEAKSRHCRGYNMQFSVIPAYECSCYCLR